MFTRGKATFSWGNKVAWQRPAAAAAMQPLPNWLSSFPAACCILQCAAAQPEQIPSNKRTWRSVLQAQEKSQRPPAMARERTQPQWSSSSTCPGREGGVRQCTCK